MHQCFILKRANFSYLPHLWAVCNTLNRLVVCHCRIGSQSKQWYQIKIKHVAVMYNMCVPNHNDCKCSHYFFCLVTPLLHNIVQDGWEQEIWAGKGNLWWIKCFVGRYRGQFFEKIIAWHWPIISSMEFIKLTR